MAQNFRLAPAEHLLRRGIPFGDILFRIDGHYRQWRGLNQRAKRFVSVAQLFFGAPAPAYIAQNASSQDPRSLRERPE